MGKFEDNFFLNDAQLCLPGKKQWKELEFINIHMTIRMACTSGCATTKVKNIFGDGFWVSCAFFRELIGCRNVK